jgi:hypothetical protein
LSQLLHAGEATVELTGFCEPCTGAELAERYLAAQDAETEARRTAWRRWDTERQRHSRLSRQPGPRSVFPLRQTRRCSPTGCCS